MQILKIVLQIFLIIGSRLLSLLKFSYIWSIFLSVCYFFLGCLNKIYASIIKIYSNVLYWWDTKFYLTEERLKYIRLHRNIEMNWWSWVKRHGWSLFIVDEHIYLMKEWCETNKFSYIYTKNRFNKINITWELWLRNFLYKYDIIEGCYRIGQHIYCLGFCYLCWWVGVNNEWAWFLPPTEIYLDYGIGMLIEDVNLYFIRLPTMMAITFYLFLCFPIYLNNKYLLGDKNWKIIAGKLWCWLEWEHLTFMLPELTNPDKPEEQLKNVYVFNYARWFWFHLWLFYTFILIVSACGDLERLQTTLSERCWYDLASHFNLQFNSWWVSYILLTWAALFSSREGFVFSFIFVHLPLYFFIHWNFQTFEMFLSMYGNNGYGYGYIKHCLEKISIYEGADCDIWARYLYYPNTSNYVFITPLFLYIFRFCWNYWIEEIWSYWIPILLYHYEQSLVRFEGRNILRQMRAAERKGRTALNGEQLLGDRWEEVIDRWEEYFDIKTRPKYPAFMGYFDEEQRETLYVQYRLDAPLAGNRDDLEMPVLKSKEDLKNETNLKYVKPTISIFLFILFLFVLVIILLYYPIWSNAFAVFKHEHPLWTCFALTMVLIIMAYNIKL